MQALFAFASAALVLGLACAAGPAQVRSHNKTAPRLGSSYGDPGDYEVYVLALSWTAEFCAERNYKDPECSGLKGSFAYSNLALHGLWPQYAEDRSGHQYPEFCWSSNSTYTNSVGSVQSSVAASFRSQWLKYAPAYVDDSLNTHEWTKHGVCFSRALESAAGDPSAVAQLQSQYFESALTLLQSVGTPPEYQGAQQSGASLTLDAVQSAIADQDHAAFACEKRDGKDYLSQVSLCFGVDSSGRPTRSMTCPSSVLQSDYDNSCFTDNVEDVYFAG